MILALVLLAFNFWAGSNAMQGPQLVRVPYSPFFLSQVRSGNVKEITSVGTAIQGTFEKPTTYGGEKPTTGFETEVPAFADTVSLSQLLETNGVVVNAKPLSTGAPWWQTLLVGFGPTLLFLGPAVPVAAPRGRHAERAQQLRTVARAALRAER